MIGAQSSSSSSSPVNLKCKLLVSLLSDRPMVGIEINPYVHVQKLTSDDLPAHNLQFTWYRISSPFRPHGMGCSFQPDGELTGVQCLYCPKTIPVEEKETEWVEVCNLKSYVPTLDDVGSCLRLESVAVDPLSGARLSLTNTIDTNPVFIPPMFQPRHMVECSSSGSNFKVVNHSTNDMAFSVVSYNVLAETSARIRSKRNRFCPPWAQVWEYRREILLHEILAYDADILCLQEVQDNHFEDFFQPELTKHGYSNSVLYKNVTTSVFMDGKLVRDGCATFYRRNLFKEIARHDLEFDQIALRYVEAVDKVKNNHRLSKKNVALVTVLETLDNVRYRYGNLDRSAICVANTHLCADTEFPDVKLFQVVSLVNELEKIVHSGMPLLICGDFNSVPLSDAYRFIVLGQCDPVYNEQQDPLGIINHLNLHHSLPLKSAYVSFPCVGAEEWLRKVNPLTKEPNFTCLTARTSVTLDYIFYTKNNLKVESLLDLLDCGRGPLRLGIPSPYWPSDHIALMARFKLLSPPPTLGNSSTAVPRPPSELDSSKQQ